MGRYADGYGINVVELLGLAKDAYGAFAWQQAKASVAPTGDEVELTSIIGGDHLEGRPFAPVVDAKAIAKVGDAESAHPGELTGIHHLPWDPRLEEEQVFSFYDVPDHPKYRWAMTVDTNACNGCGVCIAACPTRPPAIELLPLSATNPGGGE